MSKEEYKEKITELINNIQNIEKLRFIYMFIMSYTGNRG